jgi:hypothetical protein
MVYSPYLWWLGHGLWLFYQHYWIYTWVILVSPQAKLITKWDDGPSTPCWFHPPSIYFYGGGMGWEIAAHAVLHIRGTQAKCNSSNWQVELQNEIARHHCSPPMLKSSKGWKEALVLNLRAAVTAMAIAMLAIAAIARPHQVLLQLLQGNKTITWPWLKCIPAAFNNSLIHSINCSHAGYLSLFY